jgi:TonB family protein
MVFRCFSLFGTLCVAGALVLGYASASLKLEDDLGEIFVGHSFTVRNFYHGSHLRYGSDGELIEKAEPGYWSRDGMVEFTSLKISTDNKLIMQGNRTCILLDQKQGEFSNVTTGDHVQIEIQLMPDQLSRQAVLPILQKVLLSSHDRLAELVPSYWQDCLSRKVERRDKHSPWECMAADKQGVPDFSGKKITWDIPPPDTSLHNGTRHYLIQHRVAYLSEQGVKDPTLGAARDPIFDWEQNRTHIGTMKLVLAFTVGEDGRARNILIVSPVGMGIDDDAVKAVMDWRFIPAMLGGKPFAVHARVIFDIASTKPLEQ